MFTTEERKTILDEITSDFLKDEMFIGSVLVGSGALGFRDNYSDIDLVLVHKEEADISMLFSKVHEIIKRNNTIATVLNQYNRNLQVILLDNYLEIDIGFHTLDTLSARRPDFKVLFDKSGKIQDIMEKSCERNLFENKGTTEAVDMERELYRADGNLWYNIIHCVNSFVRGETYRCYYELEELRRTLISLIGKRNNKEAKRFRSVHKLNEVERKKIDPLFVYPNSNDDLKKVLLLMCEMFYEEFDSWKKDSFESFSPRVEKTFLKKYINDNLF